MTTPLRSTHRPIVTTHRPTHWPIVTTQWSPEAAGMPEQVWLQWRHFVSELPFFKRAGRVDGAPAEFHVSNVIHVTCVCRANNAM